MVFPYHILVPGQDFPFRFFLKYGAVIQVVETVTTRSSRMPANKNYFRAAW